MKRFGLILVFVFGLLSLGAASAQEGRQITIAFEGGAVTMDPHKRQETTTLAWQQHIHEYLIRMSREGELTPELATSWEATDDNTWIIELHDDVLWHDGSPSPPRTWRAP